MKRLRLDRRVGLLLGGILLANILALGGSVALPAADPELGGEAEALSRLEARGLEVYRNEGCWYCHTQYLRNTHTDAVSKTPLGPDAYLGLSPAMFGHERIGQDLSVSGIGPEGLLKVLREPGEDGPTLMPSYAYLGEADLRALAAYLLSLR